MSKRPALPQYGDRKKPKLDISRSDHHLPLSQNICTIVKGKSRHCLFIHSVTFTPNSRANSGSWHPRSVSVEWTILRDRDFASRRVCGSRMIRTAILAVISCRDLRASVEKHYISKLVRRTRFSKGEGALNVVWNRVLPLTSDENVG